MFRAIRDAIAIAWSIVRLVRTASLLHVVIVPVLLQAPSLSEILLVS